MKKVILIITVLFASSYFIEMNAELISIKDQLTSTFNNQRPHGDDEDEDEQTHTYSIVFDDPTIPQPTK